VKIIEMASRSVRSAKYNDFVLVLTLNKASEFENSNTTFVIDGVQGQITKK
jgi:hypothetical protein